MRTFEQFCELAAGAVHGFTAAQIRDVAAWCFAAQQAGESMSIWHAAALILGSKCHCALCRH